MRVPLIRSLALFALVWPLAACVAPLYRASPEGPPLEARIAAARRLAETYRPGVPPDIPSGVPQKNGDPLASGDSPVPPARLIRLFADQTEAGPDKPLPGYLQGLRWFPEPGLLNIVECEHCRGQSAAIISSQYGRRGRRFHDGIDVRAPQGSAALAFKGGAVTRAGRNRTYGNVVEVMQYDGYMARYAHLRVILVKEGQTLAAGEQLGEVGRTGRTTGSHLHFELIRDGQSHDPQRFLTRVEQIVRCLHTGKPWH